MDADVWLTHNIVRGEIDNRERGRVRGRVWLKGRDFPVELDLRGNCLRDAAGSVMRFENPNPQRDRHVRISPVQIGCVGDITASRKVRLPRAREAVTDAPGKPQPVVRRIGNCLHIEWFSERDGRIVIDSTEFTVSLTEPVWRMSPDDEQLQIMRNRLNVEHWEEELELEDELEDELEPLNEFEWERRLKESDALTDKFSEVLDKYIDHPDRHKLIAREMGWGWLEDALDQGMDEAPEDMDDDTTFHQPDPDLMTEGVDWVRSERGRITHPLTERAFQNAMKMWHYCNDRGLLDEGGDEDLREMIFQAQTLSAKLAGALDSLAFEHDVDCGFVVASLKRTLGYVNLSLSAWNKMQSKNTLAEKRLGAFRAELLGIREEILRLMQRYRQQLS